MCALHERPRPLPHFGSAAGDPRSSHVSFASALTFSTCAPGLLGKSASGALSSAAASPVQKQDATISTAGATVVMRGRSIAAPLRLRFGALGRREEVELRLVFLRVLDKVPLILEGALVRELQRIEHRSPRI